MKKFVFIIISIFLIACSKEDEPMTLTQETLAQTQWKGTLEETSDIIHDISISFVTSTSGSYRLYDPNTGKPEDINSAFSYKMVEKLLYIKVNTVSADHSLNGYWWPYRITRDEMILVQNPNSNVTATMTLHRLSLLPD